MNDIKFPKGQQVSLTYLEQGKPKYIVTKDKFDKYYLYKVDKDKPTKIKSSDNPLNFKEVYPD